MRRDISKLAAVGVSAAVPGTRKMCRQGIRTADLSEYFLLYKVGKTKCAGCIEGGGKGFDICPEMGT